MMIYRAQSGAVSVKFKLKANELLRATALTTNQLLPLPRP
jgi:hypothetical protein